MDIFNSRYYKTNYFYLRLLGLWPHDDATKKRIKRITIIFLVISLIIPQVIRLVEEWGKDIDIVIEVIGSLIYFVGCQIKYLSFLRVETKMKFLYEEIARHWKTLSNECEQKLLRDYAEVGRTMALGYIKYFIDDQKYYFELTVHGWIVCILSVQIYGTFDTTYAQCVQHACALFSIVEYRLQTVTKLGTYNEYTSKKEEDDTIYREMVDLIILHKEAIQFVNLIEECYTFVFFCVVTLNTAVVSLAAVDTMLNLENGNTKQMIRIGLLYIGFSFHLLFNMNPGQKVIDSSTHIQQAVFHCDWFNVSPKSKQLLRIMMLRSMVPCTFTANKLVVLDLESFAFVFKKSISYVTVIGSMR